MLFYLICLVNLNAALTFSSYEFNTWVPGEHKYHGVHDGMEHTKQFVNEWTVVVDGDEDVAQLVALELGYIYGGRVAAFPNTYTFLKYEHEKQRRAPSSHTSTLVKDRRVRTCVCSV